MSQRAVYEVIDFGLGNFGLLKDGSPLSEADYESLVATIDRTHEENAALRQQIEHLKDYQSRVLDPIATPAAASDGSKRYQLAQERGCTCVQAVEQDGIRDVVTTIAAFSDGAGHKASELAREFLAL